MASPATTGASDAATPMELDAIIVSPHDDGDDSIVSPFMTRGVAATSPSIVAPRHFRSLAIACRSIAAHARVESRLERLAAIENDMHLNGAAPAMVERIQELECAHRAIRAKAVKWDTAPPTDGGFDMHALRRVAHSLLACEPAKSSIELIYELMQSAKMMGLDKLPASELLSVGDRRRVAVEKVLHGFGTGITVRALGDIRGGMIEFIIDSSNVVEVAAKSVSTCTRFFQRLACC